MNNLQTLDDSARLIPNECSLSQGACDVPIDINYTLQFALQPRTLPVMEPVFLSVSGLSDELVFRKAWFEGRDMNMGRHFLVPVEKQDENSRRYLKGVIPVCHIDGDMVWRLVAEFSFKQELIHIYFDQSSLNE